MDTPKRRTSKLPIIGGRQSQPQETGLTVSITLDKELAALNEELKGARLRKVLKRLDKKKP